MSNCNNPLKIKIKELTLKRLQSETYENKSELSASVARKRIHTVMYIYININKQKQNFNKLLNTIHNKREQCKFD